MIKQLRLDYEAATKERPTVNRPTNSDSGDREHLPPSNDELAESLREVANLLQVQGANRFRVEAYFRVANMLTALDKPAWQIYESEGIDGLEELPGVGRTISKALQQMIRGGRWPLLERLNGNDSIETAFASVPNIGPVFAKRIHEELGLETLAELQAAAWDGRLEQLPGMGEKRLRAVRESLAGRGRYQRPVPINSDNRDVTNQIPVGELLDLDDQYRFEARHNTLPRVAPKQNNPAHEAWLPIMHTERGDRHYTLMFSNTSHAHQLGTNQDWVVIYLEDHDHTGQHGRWTVITSRFGKLRGKRIVRGREHECEAYYRDRVN